MAGRIIGSNNEPLKIQFITDTHYFSRKLYSPGKAYDKAESKSQKLIKDTDIAIKAGFDLLCEDKSTDIVVLAGDTTKDGEMESHKEFIEMLRDLKARGKRVYVITATHDFQGDGLADRYVGDKTERIEAVKDRHDLWDMYYEFGPNEAIATHKESMCYVVQLAPGYRLFALNDDTNYKPEGESGSGFSDDCMAWILEQLEDAKKNDQYVIAMTHHPMISPSPFYSIIGKGDMQRNHETTREIFADAGLSCMLTGHTHVHDISVITTKKGNKFYDVACGAMVGCPPVMRNVTFDPQNAKIDVDTITIKDVPGLDTDGKPFDEYMRGFFFGMIGEVIWAMGNDIDRLAEMTPAFSIPGEKVKKLAWIIKPVGKFLNKLTFKKIWRLCKKECGLKKADIADIADNKVTDFILELVQNLYCGDSPYSPDTREYKLTCGLLNIIDSFLDTIHFSIGKVLKGATSVRSLIEPLLWNSGYCDAMATLPLYPIYDDDNPAPASAFEEKQFTDTVKKSKKGPLVLLLLILIVLLVLALVVGLVALLVWAVVAIIHACTGTAFLSLLF
ncbi:metallophosphoesterase [uncultured Eubacterium sp.]|uniref:metallophosphoesterase family protein n=1 Tax=uncultured Eubacterium sp. TaxID=165185 RepID=UPI0015BB8C96|nr:metallophosphoesterase [uncultured Eubacterium sp.]